MNKWNGQAAPNNNQKSSDMDPGIKAACVEIKGLSKEGVSDMKTENEIRNLNL